MAAIGIDFGTTLCCMAICRDNKIEIIKNERGNHTTPSCVAFTPNGMIAGESAKSQTIRNVENTLYSVKRMIGRTKDDTFIEKLKDNSSLKLVENNERIKIKVQYKDEYKQYYPEEISAMLLKKLKSDAEAYIQDKVEYAVITVPAAFEMNQRQCTKDAASIAGLEVFRLLNEPTAAAIAYGLDRRCPERGNILVYDLGGGTFDVSIMQKKGTKFTILNTGGDKNLGGEDFDSLLVNYCVEEFVRDYQLDPRDSKRAMVRLRSACEEAKHYLSFGEKANIDINCLYKGQDFEFIITRTAFENMCKPLFHRTLDILNKTILDANLKIEDIDDIVMIGGSTFIPYVKEIVKSFFKGKNIQTMLNPLEAVARGAAIYAANRHRTDENNRNELILIEKTSHSLGIKKEGGLMEFLIPRATQYPCSKTKFFTTRRDNQTEVDVTVYEGEHELVHKNILLGNFTIAEIPMQAMYSPKIKITFDIDADGVLTVTGVLMPAGRLEGIVIKRDSSILTEKEKLIFTKEVAEMHLTIGI